MITELTESEYLATMKNIRDVTETAEPVIDIWPHVTPFVSLGLVEKYIVDEELVQYVYRSGDDAFEHVLLPTNNENRFIVLVIDLRKKELKGYFDLDLNEKYGI